MELTDLLNQLTAANGTDLHLVANQPPVFRLGGELTRQTDLPILDAASLEALLRPHLTEAQQASLEHGRQDVEKTLRIGSSRFRLHVFYERGNLAACARVVPTQVPTLDQLGMGKEDLPVLQEILRNPRGLVLVTGVTGSGKSTTIAAMIEEINRTRAERILTIEDPIEYEFESKQSLISQRTVGEDVPNFTFALRSAFREDPDVLLVGETRDLETMALTLALAETGHLVFSVLHLGSASAAVERLIESYPESQQPVIRRSVAQNLVAVIAQRLLLRHDNPSKPPRRRIPANEIMVVTPRIRRMILEGQKDLSVAIEAGREEGMQTMDDSLTRLYERGIISFETAWMHLEDKDRIKKDAATALSQPVLAG
jgi:twitching motility protein PilT